jgi:inorganic pyrophosphatase/exopolyphosphatase
MGRPKKNPNERKIVEIKKLRIPMVKLLNGKDIRTAAKNLEDFRLKMKEEEILLGATLTVKRDAWNDDFHLVATRPETDQELAERLEKERLAAEAKKKREAERKAKEEKAKAEREQRRIAEALEDLRKHAMIHGIPMDVLVDSLKTW